MPAQSYLSRRRKIVIHAIETLARPFTAHQLWESVSQDHPDISRATVYRTLRQLRDEGFLKDIILPHGLHVSVRTRSDSYCILECDHCGGFTFRPELARKINLPGQIAIHIRTPCSTCQPEPGPAATTFRTPLANNAPRHR